jgi:hypothetical protein
MTFSAESIRLLWIDPVFTAVYGVALNEFLNIVLDLLLLLWGMGWSARTLQPRNLQLRWWENRDLQEYKNMVRIQIGYMIEKKKTESCFTRCTSKRNASFLRSFDFAGRRWSSFFIAVTATAAAAARARLGVTGKHK